MIDPYQCSFCGVTFVVRCLARDCEATHTSELAAPPQHSLSAPHNMPRGPRSRGSNREDRERDESLMDVRPAR